MYSAGLRAGVDYKKHRKFQSTSNEIHLFRSTEESPANVPAPQGLQPRSPKRLDQAVRVESPKKLMAGQGVAKLELKMFRQDSQEEASRESEGRPGGDDEHLVAEERAPAGQGKPNDLNLEAPQYYGSSPGGSKRLSL